ncbi:hypothetical protein NIES2107_15500 [Nostoc carneum NIES-2107]|nr:hypothetical protein NIES2107_15500 [Nostoc carneum NIES-2107]
MAKIILNQIIEQLKSLEMEELEQLHQTVEKYIANREETVKQAAFHKALIDGGLVKQIKHPLYEAITERRLIQTEGKPISETIIEERR